MSEEKDVDEFQKELEKAKTFSFSDSPKIERSEAVEWIEPTVDASRFDMDSVKDTIKVQGYELEEPEPPDPEAVKKAMRRSDPTADYRRNKNAYGIICPICFDSKKCVECNGRGRKKLFFRCKNCNGSGKCPECEKDIGVHCPKCDEPVSKYSDTCRKCGVRFSCPECSSNIPAMATTCVSCKTTFKCKYCGKPYPRQYSWRCPHCNHWDE